MGDSSNDGRRRLEYAPVEVDFSPDPGFTLLFDGLHAEEELGRPFLIQVDLSTGQLQPGISKLIGGTCCVWMYQAEDKSTPDRYFHGIVTRVVSAGMLGGAYRYKVELRPWIWLLSQVTDCCIFQKKSAFQIVTDIFRNAGFSDFEDKRQASAGEAQLEYCVQYHETSLAFVTRLMEQYGFYYFFTHARDKHTLVFADDPNSHEVIDTALPFQSDQTEFRKVDAHIWVWSTDLGLNTDQWTFQDYNFQTPSADLTAKTLKPQSHQYKPFEVYEYPGIYENTDDGLRLADIRMQALVYQRQMYVAQSNSRALWTGKQFKLSGHPDNAVNRSHLIVHSTVTVGSAEGTPNPQAETIDTYRIEMRCIPGDTAFRLQRKTPRPMIRGPQTARVVGDAGEEITTDSLGRVKVRFHWDRSDTQDSDRTCWIRVTQSWASGSWGAMTIPRVGQEVVVEFLEGDPDRPLITGVVYNGNNQVPYPLPENKTRTTLMSNSSPGGSGFNEFRIEDKAGEEEVYLHAAYDYNREVKHDETAKITNDRTVTITSGNDSLTVSSGNHSVTVSSGNHSLSVSSGKSEVSAAQSITLSVGANSIKIDTEGITINGMKVGVQASTTMSLNATAAMSLNGATISLN